MKRRLDDEWMEKSEELWKLAQQHRPGTVHARDRRPCKGECGRIVPSTMTYCATCMVGLLCQEMWDLAGARGFLEARLEEAREAEAERMMGEG
jgi:hypothetical protein